MKAKDRYRFINGKANDGYSFDYGDVDFTRAAELEKRGVGTLGELLHKPSFYAAYPELAELPVKVVEGSYVPLRYDSRSKLILGERGNKHSNCNKRRAEKLKSQGVGEYHRRYGSYA